MVQFDRLSVVVAALLALTALYPAGALSADHINTIVAFDPKAGEFPESIAVDKTGNLFVSMFVLDQIRRIDQDGAQTVVAQLPRAAAPAGVKLSASGTLYVAATGFDLTTGQTDPASRGVYRLRPGQSAERIPGTNVIQFPNDLAFDNLGNIYVSDPVGGAVWRIDRNESVEMWTSDPLLEGTGTSLGFPYGVNGIAFHHGGLVVSNTDRGILVAIPIHQGGSAGVPTVLAESPLLLGVDGIALDVRGNVYAAVNGQDMLVAARIDGRIDILATASDGLNQPSSVAFGTGSRDHRTLFLVNFAVASAAPTPGVLAVPLGAPGQPLP